MTRRVKTKRGGMQRAVSAARTSYFYTLVPLLKQYHNYLLTTKAPLPSDGVMVNYGEKYRTLLEGVEIDNGIKESIRNFKNELDGPVKGADKFKELAEMYNKLISELERKRKEKGEPTIYQRSIGSFQNTAASQSPLLYLQGKSYGSQSPSSSSSSSSSSPFAHTPQKLTRVHFNTPSKPKSTELTTPPRLRAHEKGAQPITDNDDLSIQGTQLFPNDENSTPINSPVKSTPGRVPSKSAPRSLFSPSRPPFRLG
jgi:hypothetical protein